MSDNVKSNNAQFPQTRLLSNRATWAIGQPIDELMAMALAKPNIISLAAGFVDNETLPVEMTRNAVTDMLAESPAPLQYGTNHGDPELREMLLSNSVAQDNAAAQTQQACQTQLEQVLITPGSNQLLYMVADTLLDPGDIVICAAPSYFVFMGAVKNVGGRTLGIAIDQQGMLPDALEEALQLREKNGDGEVVVISLGPDRVQKVIREGLAKGADRGIHIQVDSAAAVDPLVTASSIANAIKEEKFDLIFSGLQSDDIGMGQTGIILGEILGMSTASLVMATELSENRIKVKRELEAGFFQWVTMTLPSSVTIQSGLNTPRYPSLKGIMGAKKKEINVLTPGGSEPKQSMNKVYVPQSEKQTVMIDGSVDEIVDKLIETFRNDIKVI